MHYSSLEHIVHCMNLHAIPRLAVVYAVYDSTTLTCTYLEHAQS